MFRFIVGSDFHNNSDGLDKNASTAINQLVQEGRENSETFDKLCDKVSDAQQFVKNNSAAIVQTGAGLVEMVAGIGVSGVSAIGGGAAIVLSDGTLYYPAMAATSAGVGAGVAIYDNGAKDFADGISKMESRGGESSGGGESESFGNASSNSEIAPEGSTIVHCTTRGQEPGVRITKPDGSIIDITPTRVKEYTPVTDPRAPEGLVDQVRFPETVSTLPGSKGLKRYPTAEELKVLKGGGE